MPAALRDREGAYAGGKGGEEPWDLIFSTAVRHYYKDSRMRELDAEIGDIYASICGTLGSAYRSLATNRITDREIEIIHGLGQDVLQYEDLLNSISDICGEVDSYVGYISLSHHLLTLEVCLH